MTHSIRIRWTPRVLIETWNRRMAGETTAQIACALGISNANLRMAWRRAGYDMSLLKQRPDLQEIAERVKNGEKIMAIATERGMTYVNLYNQLKYHKLLDPIRRQWREVEVADIEQQIALGVPMSSIAEEYGVSPAALHQLLYRRRDVKVRFEWTPERVRHALKLKKRGMTYDEVAVEVGAASGISVRNTLRAAGVTPKRNRWTAARIRQVKKRLASGDSLNKVARDFGINRQSLRRALNRRGIEC